MRDVLTHDDIWCGAMTDLDQFWPACARSEDEAGPYQQQIELLVDHDKNVLNDLKQLLHNNNNHMDNRTLEGETVEGMYDVPYLVALFVSQKGRCAMTGIEMTLASGEFNTHQHDTRDGN